MFYQPNANTNQINKQKQTNVTVESFVFNPKKRKNKLQNEHHFCDLTLSRKHNINFDENTSLVEVFNDKYDSNYYSPIREEAKKLIEQGATNLYIVRNEITRKLVITDSLDLFA